MPLRFHRIRSELAFDGRFGKNVRVVMFIQHIVGDVLNDCSCFFVIDQGGCFDIMVQQCLSLLSETDREILIRHANGETYAALANAYGYKTAGGMQKRIVRIKKQVADRMGINVE